MTTIDYNLIIPDFERRKAKYAPIAKALGDVYGYPAWRQWLPPLDELVSCILSQSTTDTNRDRAFDALKARFKTYEEVRDAVEKVRRQAEEAVRKERENRRAEKQP